MTNPYKKDFSHPIGGCRVALVHDFLLYPGGAEQVLAVLARMFPHAPIYTIAYDAQRMRGLFADRKIITSPLQRMPRWIRNRPWLFLPFLPIMPELWDLRAYDIVISSSSAWSKGIVTRVTTTHVAYIHSPMRFVWDENSTYMRQRLRHMYGIFAIPLRWIFSRLRIWDYEAAQRPDLLIANAQYTASRIQKYYRRHARVIYPPVTQIGSACDPDLRTPEEKPFVIVGRLSEYKNVDNAVDVCTKLSMPLVVVGEGRCAQRVRKNAGSTIRFVGWQDDAQRAAWYRSARAVLFPSEEDFGLVIAEALSAGTPVIAYRRGGAAELIEEGKTGEFFDAQVPESLADGIRRFLENESSYDRAAMCAAAARFTEDRFVTDMQDAIATVCAQTQTNKTQKI